MKTAILAISLLMTSAAQADDMMFKSDKQFHFGTSAVVAGSLNAVTDPWTAFGLTVAGGAAKEWYDSKHRDKHCASREDFAYDVLGAAIGAYAGHKIKGLIIESRNKGVFVSASFEVK